MSRHDIDSMVNSFVVSLDITVTSNILQEIVQILSKKYTKKSNFILIQQRCIPEKQLTKWSFYQTVNKRIKVCQNFWQRKYFCLVRELQELFPYSTVWLWIAWFMDKLLISRESFLSASQWDKCVGSIYARNEFLQKKKHIRDTLHLQDQPLMSSSCYATNSINLLQIYSLCISFSKWKWLNLLYAFFQRLTRFLSQNHFAAYFYDHF